MTRQAPPTGNSAANNRCAAAGLMLLAASSGLAQTAAPVKPAPAESAAKPYVATMTFDVASVRENKNIDVYAGFTMSGGRFVAHTTSVRLVNWRMESLISNAYGADEFQIVGGPKWPFPTLFVIEAKSDSEADAKMAALTAEQQKAEQQHMMQVLLAERFALKAHWETREGDVYNLVVVKGGSKLGAQGSMPPSAEELKNFGGHLPPIHQTNDGRGYDFIAHGCSILQLVDMLRIQFGRPVHNGTGLSGNYDFVLKYRGRWDRDRSDDDMDPMPPLDRALQEELGLKVEAARGPVKVLVIDHVEKPSEN